MMYRMKLATFLAVVSVGSQMANAFLPNGSSLTRGCRKQTVVNRSPFVANIDARVAPSALRAGNGISVDTSSLAQYFLETLISYGVPTAFTLIVIIFAAKSFRGSKENNSNGGFFGKNVVTELYDDLYEDNRGSSSPFEMFASRKGSKNAPKNLGIPKNQYISITKLNDVYQSYDYTLTAATQSKAKAAAQYRSKAFDSALQKSFGSSLEDITAAQKTDLLMEEKEFLKRGGDILSSMTSLQAQLTDLVIKDEMKQMDVEIGEIDARDNIVDATIVDESTTKESNSTDVAIAEKSGNKKSSKKSGSAAYKKDINKLTKEIEKQSTELLKLELDFIRDVIDIMGPERANGIRSALLGNISGGGSVTGGALLKNLQERPLSLVLQKIGYSDDGQSTKNLFVSDFPGDVSASQVETLREEVTAIIRSSKPGDEALLILQSGGGTVTGYGLAAAQLQRFKANGIKLTICVEQVAASGGYMMTCVADKVVASPFAVLGSIGVISDLPNVYERLKKEGVEFQTVTAGKFKRTLTPTKKVTKEDIEKQKADLEDILTLFKGFVKENRPSLDIDTVATGETWFGDDALERGLCDEIKTVDDVLSEYVDSGFNVFELKYSPPLDTSSLGSLLPLGQSGKKGGGLIRSILRSFVETMVSVIEEEMSTELKADSLKDRYMAKDPTNTKNFRM